MKFESGRPSGFLAKTGDSIHQEKSLRLKPDQNACLEGSV